jgi:hypothetical protein
VLIYDVDEANRATLLTRGASLVGAGTVEFDLYPQDWRLRAGHRIGVLLAGSDDFYFDPGRSDTPVEVTSGEIELPLVPSPRGPDLAGGPSRAVIERTSFPVAPEVLHDRAEALVLPAAAVRPRRRLVLRVRPRSVRANRPVRLRIRTRDAGGRTVPRARVRVGRRLLRTGSRGRLRARIRFTRPGRRALRASKPGYSRARTVVRVKRP